MNNTRILSALTLAVVLAIPAFAEPAQRALNFASDFQTVPVMANTTGVGGARFVSYVAILNPTSSSFSIEATLFDAFGATREATITLAAGEMKTFTNFLDEVFDFAGGGAVTFRSPDASNRFIVSTEVRTEGAAFSTPVTVLEFPASNSRSFSMGITVNASSRANIGCFNQSDVQNVITATVRDKNGLALGTINLTLAANAWGQTGVNTVVSDGIIQFDPAEAASCYAVVVSNSTHDGRFVAAVEYEP